jgi:hypothetical protein
VPAATSYTRLARLLHLSALKDDAAYGCSR